MTVGPPGSTKALIHEIPRAGTRVDTANAMGSALKAGRYLPNPPLPEIAKPTLSAYVRRMPDDLRPYRQPDQQIVDDRPLRTDHDFTAKDWRSAERRLAIGWLLIVGGLLFLFDLSPTNVLWMIVVIAIGVAFVVEALRNLREGFRPFHEWRQFRTITPSNPVRRFFRLGPSQADRKAAWEAAWSEQYPDLYARQKPPPVE